MRDSKEVWGYRFFVGGIVAGAAFAGLFVRVPHWVKYESVKELLYTIYIVIFATIGARSAVWLYERKYVRPERERVAAIMKAADAREKQKREAAEFAERVRLSQQAAEADELKKRCKQYETEVRVLRAELARRAPYANTLLCE